MSNIESRCCVYCPCVRITAIGSTGAATSPPSRFELTFSVCRFPMHCLSLAAVATNPTESSSLESYLSNADPLNTLNALRFIQKEVLHNGKGQVSSTDLHRMYKVYPILLDRVFGEVEIVGSRKMESNGGWLAYSTRLVVVVWDFLLLGSDE